MKLVIGLCGRIGSGKTVVSEYLHKNYGASQRRFSQILMDILDRLYLPHNREYLQKLGAALRNSIGPDVIANAFEKDIENEKNEIVVIDGIRYSNEVKLLRKFENNILIYINAPAEIRYGRCISRGEKGESNISFGEFIESENMETERMIDDIGKTADYTIENSGSIEELYKSIKKIIRERNICNLTNSPKAI